MIYLELSGSYNIYIDDGKLNMEYKIKKGKRTKTLKCRYNGKMWNSKIVDTLSGEEYLSSGTLEKISSDIENKLGIKIKSRCNLQKLLSDHFLGIE